MISDDSIKLWKVISSFSKREVSSKVSIKKFSRIYTILLDVYGDIELFPVKTQVDFKLRVPLTQKLINFWVNYNFFSILHLWFFSYF